MNNNNQNNVYEGLFGKVQQIHEASNQYKGGSIAGYEMRIALEENLEKMVTSSFLHPTINSILRVAGADFKRMAFAKISQVTNNLLRSKNVESLELINIAPLTLEVYELIKHYPTVQRVCGDHKSLAEHSMKKQERDKFISALALFVGRQLLISKYRIGTIRGDGVRGATEEFVFNYEITRHLFTAIHQAANKVLAGGTHPNYLRDIVREVSEQSKSDLASFVKDNFQVNTEGYLEDMTNKVEQLQDTFIDPSLDDILGANKVDLDFMKEAAE